MPSYRGDSFGERFQGSLFVAEWGQYRQPPARAEGQPGRAPAAAVLPRSRRSLAGLRASDRRHRGSARRPARRRLRTRPDLPDPGRRERDKVRPRMAITTDVEGRGGLEEHGIETGGRVFLHPTTSLLYTHAAPARRRAPGRGRPARRRHRAATPAARRRRSSSSESRAPRSGSGGATSTRRSPRSTSRGCATRSSRTSGTEDLYVVDAFAGADPAYRLRRARDHVQPLARALREDALHRPERGGARRLRAARARAACARGRGRPRRGRDAQRHLRRAAPVARRRS